MGLIEKYVSFMFLSILPILRLSIASYRYVTVLANVPKIRYSYSKSLYRTVTPIL